MKQLILNVPDDKYKFVLELVKNMDFMKVVEEKEPTKKEILQGLKEAVVELNEIKAGKRKAKSLKDFLNEL